MTLWGIKYKPCSHKTVGRRQNALSLLNFPPAFIQTTAASYINDFPLSPVNYDSFCENELFCRRKKKRHSFMVIGRLESFPKKSLHHLRRGSTSVFWTLHWDISFMSYASRWLDVIYSQAAHVLVLWKTADTSVVLPASCPVRAGIHVMFWVNMANVLAHSCLFTYPADTFLTTCPKFTDCVLTSHHGLQYLAV